MAMLTSTVLGIIGVAVAAGSASYSAYVQQDNAADAEKAAGVAADQTNAAAARDAALIRERAQKLKSMQTAAIAAGGASMASGTSGSILGETDRLSERDALAAIKEGSDRATLIRMQGGVSAGAMRGQAVASALGGVSNILGGITSYQKATEGSRTADTINMDATKMFNSSAPKYSLLSGG